MEAEINVNNGLDREELVNCLFLVAADTKFSSRTPIILGTNILTKLLEDCRSNCGDRFLQTAKIHSPWYLSFRLLVTRERNLQKNKSCLAVVRCALMEKIQIHHNESRNIKSYTDKCLEYHHTSAIMQNTEGPSVPD